MNEISDEEAQELLKTWKQFCELAGKAGEQILRPEVPKTDLDVAEGFRYVSRMVALAFDLFIEESDPQRPRITWTSTTKRRPFFLNPDQTYHNIPVSPEHTYRLRGNRRDGRNPPELVEVQSWVGNMFATLDTTDEGKRGNELTEYLLEGDIDFEDDGSFEIILSATEHERNWLKLAPGTSMVLIRQYVTDWEKQSPWELSIECLDGPKEPFRLSTKSMIGSLQIGALFTLGATARWLEWINNYAKEGNVNNFPRWLDPYDEYAPKGIRYRTARFELADDEALIVSFQKPDTPYWGFTITNFWLEVSDWHHGERASFNQSSCEVDEDGWVRVVLAHEDPGVRNWLPTQGHHTGMYTLRWARRYDWEPESSAELVPLSKVKEHLP